jgi:hypothetical protein
MIKNSRKAIAVTCTIALLSIVIICLYLFFNQKKTNLAGSEIRATPTPTEEKQSTLNTEKESPNSIGNTQITPETTLATAMPTSIDTHTPIITPTPIAAELTPMVSQTLVAESTPILTPSQIEEAASDGIMLKEITREEAGLDSIPYLDFSGFSLNQRIHELLIEKKPYTDEDMSAGIVAPFFVTERFQELIIDNISIGTSINDVIDLLGTPSYRLENAIIYKTDNYYVAFYGKEYIETANFSPRPETYDNDVLKTIFTGLCLENIYLTDFLENNNTITSFFESTGFIHGGGHYAFSDNGVEVDTLSNYIGIHNNFEGDLYRADIETDFDIKYINSDSIVEDILWDFSEYSFTNEDFLEKGKLSPSGKYIAKYDYIYSMSHYFTIRTMDYSKPDYTISALVNDFEWINDDFIIYTGTFSNLPTVIKATPDDYDYECIRLFPEIDDIDYDYSHNEYSFIIKDINENVIVLEDEEADTSKGEKVIWEFHYSIDENGNFVLLDY